MLKLGALVVGLALLHVGCDDDVDDIDDIDDIDDGPNDMFPDEPGTARMFQVALTPANDVPACAAAGVSATGSVTVTISADETFVSVEGLRFSGLSSSAQVAHISAAPAGIAGPFVFDLTRMLINPTTITFSSGSYPNPAEPGAPANFSGMISAMKAGLTYANLTSAKCPAGEIRGQLQ